MAKKVYVSAYQKAEQERLKKEPNRRRLPKKAIIIMSFAVDKSEYFDMDDDFGIPRMPIVKTIKNICYDFNTGYEGPIVEMWRTNNTSKINAGFHMYGQDNKPVHGTVTWDLETGDLTHFFGLGKGGEEHTYYGGE